VRRTQCPSGQARAGNYLGVPRSEERPGPGDRRSRRRGCRRSLRGRRGARGVAPPLCRSAQVLYDRGFVCTPEPFRKLRQPGIILGRRNSPPTQDASGSGRKEGQNYSSTRPRGFSPAGTRESSAAKNSLTPFSAGQAGVPATCRNRGGFRAEGDPGSAWIAGPTNVQEPWQRGETPIRWSPDCGADSLRPLRDVHGPAGGGEAWSMEGRERGARLLGTASADDRGRTGGIMRLNAPCRMRSDAAQNRVLHRRSRP